MQIVYYSPATPSSAANQRASSVRASAFQVQESILCPRTQTNRLSVPPIAKLRRRFRRAAQDQPIQVALLHKQLWRAHRPAARPSLAHHRRLGSFGLLIQQRTGWTASRQVSKVQYLHLGFIRSPFILLSCSSCQSEQLISITGSICIEGPTKGC